MTDDPIAAVRAVGLATVQDGGRPGWADAGVPSSGAWHRGRYLAATALLAGHPDVSGPAVELVAGDLDLEVLADTVGAVVGPATLEIDGRHAAVGTALPAAAGARWVVRPHGRGPVYLVVAGWRPTRVLGSVATDTFSGIGAPLGPGETLRGCADPDAARRIGTFLLAPPEGPTAAPVIRVVPTGSSALVGLAWQVQSVARSGVRMTSGRVVEELRGGLVPASAPMLPGAVQVTPAGEAIVLGPDGGLTGGYPVIGVVATVDLDLLSLLLPGDTPRLQTVTARDAQQAFAARPGPTAVHPHHLA
ncbi:MAG: hypothetical protein ACKO04_11545 [Actinomycetes bacterium]